MSGFMALSHAAVFQHIWPFSRMRGYELLHSGFIQLTKLSDCAKPCPAFLGIWGMVWFSA
jgi:hypothetical protein